MSAATPKDQGRTGSQTTDTHPSQPRRPESGIGVWGGSLPGAPMAAFLPRPHTSLLQRSLIPPQGLRPHGLTTSQRPRLLTPHRKGWASTCAWGAANTGLEPEPRGSRWEPSRHLPWEPGGKFSLPFSSPGGWGRGGELPPHTAAQPFRASAGGGAAAGRGGSLGPGQLSGMQPASSLLAGTARHQAPGWWIWWVCWRPQPPAAAQPRAGCPRPAPGACTCGQHEWASVAGQPLWGGSWGAEPRGQSCFLAGRDPAPH